MTASTTQTRERGAAALTPQSRSGEFGPRPSGGAHAPRPYVGLTPFRDTPEDRALFFGRSAERNELLNLVLSESLVVLFGRSGLGKSSLINAALLEDLRNDRYFPIATRINDVARGPVGSVLQCVELAARKDNVTIVGKRSDDLWSYFSQVEFRSADRVMRPVLIIDQFEELFTAYDPGAPACELFVRRLSDLARRRVPESVRAAAAARLADLAPHATEQVGHAADPHHDEQSSAQAAERAALLRLVYEDVSPDVKIVLVIREDYLPELHSLKASIPFILRNSIRLEPFTVAQAREAIIGPVHADVVYSKGGITFAPGVVELMIDELRVHDVGGRRFKGDRVEPLQLAILCRFLYERRHGTEPMTAARLRRVGGLRQAVKNYYLSVVRRLPRLRLGPNGRGWRIGYDNFILFNRPRIAFFRLCERGLIDAGGFRSSLNAPVVMGKYGLAERDLRVVLEQRLLTAEARPGTTAYELAHDSLVRPLRQLRFKRRLRRIGYGVMGTFAFFAWLGSLGTGMDRATVNNKDATITRRREALGRLVSSKENLRGVQLVEVDLSRAFLRHALLDSADFSRATLDSALADSASLRGAILSNSSLRSASFAGALLDGADLSAANARSASFDNADLRGVVATRASFAGARFTHARLGGANLRATDLRGADFTGSSIDRTSFAETAWWLAHGWSDSQLVALRRDFSLDSFVAGGGYRRAMDSLTRAIDAARSSGGHDEQPEIADARVATMLHRRALYVAVAGTDLDAAYADVERALRQLRDSSAPALLDTRAYILLRRVWGHDAAYRDRRRGDAQRDLTRALRVDAGADSATLGERYYHLALAYLALNDSVPARHAFQRADDLGYEASYERLLTPPEHAHGVNRVADLAPAVPSTLPSDLLGGADVTNGPAALFVGKPAPGQHAATERAARVVARGQVINAVDSLYPETAAKVKKLLAEAERQGMKPVVYETYRTPELQSLYYARRVVTKTSTIPAAGSPRYSTHWCRVAIDIIDADRQWNAPREWYVQLGKIGTDAGLTWFGDASHGGDLTHFEDPPSVRAPCRVVNGNVTPPGKE